MRGPKVARPPVRHNFVRLVCVKCLRLFREDHTAAVLNSQSYNPGSDTSPTVQSKTAIFTGLDSEMVFTYYLHQPYDLLLLI